MAVQARRGIDALRIAGILLGVGVTIVAVPATLTQAMQSQDTPWWFHLPVTGLVAVVVVLSAGGALGLGTTRLAARVHTSVVLVATLVLPEVTRTTYTEDTPPWLHAYLPSAIAAVVLVSRRWPANLALGVALVLADLRLRATVWPVPGPELLNDVLFELTVMAMGAAVLTSMTLSQRDLEREASATADRFLLARETERLGRRNAHWDALVHDEILAALETIALDPPDVDVRSVATSALAGLGAGPPQGDVDHVVFRQSVLDAVLAELPTASTRCVAPPGARLVPSEAAEALLMALTEALRNAATHAYDEAGGEVAVRLSHGTQRVAIAVSDEGRGFDRSRVRPTSFGLALSIEGRLGAVGGLATVRSVPGKGTTVHLVWPAGSAR